MWLKEERERVFAGKRATPKEPEKKKQEVGKGSALGPQDKINNLHIFGQTVYKDYYISAEYTHNMRLYKRHLITFPEAECSQLIAKVICTPPTPHS